MQMSVRLSDEKCSRAHNIHLSLSGQSQVSLCAYFVRKTEPKILRLVILLLGLFHKACACGLSYIRFMENVNLDPRRLGSTNPCLLFKASFIDWARPIGGPCNAVGQPELK